MPNRAAVAATGVPALGCRTGARAGGFSSMRSRICRWIAGALLGAGIASCGGARPVPEGMLTVPAGPFWMGCNEAVDADCDPDERPYHELTLPAFHIDATEVTQAAYARCVTEGACRIPWCEWSPEANGRYPATCVSWHDATAYCAWAGKRLPTEAEWEKAARGDDGRRFPWGNESASCERAVLDEGTGRGCGAERPEPVGARPAGASPYGVLDLAGNVWEWVADRYGADYYATPAASSPDPHGPDEGAFRVCRGGGWEVDGVLLRASSRDHATPVDGSPGLGFRCAVEAQ